VIARSWRGWVSTDDADAYIAYMGQTGLPGYASTPGFLGAYFLRRDLEGGRTEVVALSLWSSMEAIVRFAGPEPERAVFYPDDDQFLIDRETTVSHFTVTLSSTPPS
jgi:heme-degrading monooxygenase HmoA